MLYSFAQMVRVAILHQHHSDSLLSEPSDVVSNFMKIEKYKTQTYSSEKKYSFE